MRPTEARFPLDPTGHARRLAEYDSGLGWTAHLARCRAAFRRPGGPRDHPLNRTLYTVLPMLDAATCAELRALIDGDSDRLLDDGLILALLSRLFAPRTDHALTAFFRSEYLADWFSFQRAEADETTNPSLRWHFDSGSTWFLKILCYLNGTEDHGAPTRVLNAAQSAALAKAGYGFPEVGDRLDDLAPLAARLGCACDPISIPAAEGDGLIFNPQLLLHRGERPDGAHRYLLQVCVVPSPIPWHAAFRHGRKPRHEAGSSRHPRLPTRDPDGGATR